MFIEVERRKLTAAAIFQFVGVEERIAMSVVSVTELLLGVHLGSPLERRSARAAFVESVLNRVPIIPFDLYVARVYSEVWAKLRLAGDLIAPHDLIIGTTALAHGFDVLTHNVRDFDRVPGLVVRVTLDIT